MIKTNLNTDQEQVEMLIQVFLHLGVIKKVFFFGISIYIYPSLLVNEIIMKSETCTVIELSLCVYCPVKTCDTKGF